MDIEFQNRKTVITIGTQLLGYAKNGQLEPLTKLLRAANFHLKILNYSESKRYCELSSFPSWSSKPESLLSAAIRAGHEDIVKFLLIIRANPTIHPKKNRIQILDALKYPREFKGQRMISLVDKAVNFWWDVAFHHSPANRPKLFQEYRRTLEKF